MSEGTKKKETKAKSIIELAPFCMKCLTTLKHSVDGYFVCMNNDCPIAYCLQVDICQLPVRGGAVTKEEYEKGLNNVYSQHSVLKNNLQKTKKLIKQAN